MRKFLLFIALTLAFSGCGQSGVVEHRTAMTIDQVQHNVLKVAQDKFPEIKFDEAWKLDTGVIEVRGKAKTGKIREVEVSPAGEIVEIE